MCIRDRCELLPFGAFAQSDVGQQLALAAAQSLEEENGEATIIGKCGDNLQWSLSSDGVLTIDGTGEMDDYRPLNYPLAPWNAHMNKINTIIANSGMTHIGNSAFYYCSSLTAVTIPDSVISIGEQAFIGCSSLGSVDIPGSVTSIGNYAFDYCSSLTAITIPNSVTSIGNSAFANCTSLSDVYYSGTQEQWDACLLYTSDAADE